MSNIHKDVFLNKMSTSVLVYGVSEWLQIYLLKLSVFPVLCYINLHFKLQIYF